MPKDIIKPSAVYRVIPNPGSGFGVEVTIEDTSPTVVTSFATEEAANDWIAGHKERVLNPVSRGRWRTRASA